MRVPAGRRRTGPCLRPMQAPSITVVHGCCAPCGLASCKPLVPLGGTVEHAFRLSVHTDSAGRNVNADAAWDAAVGTDVHCRVAPLVYFGHLPVWLSHVPGASLAFGKAVLPRAGSNWARRHATPTCSAAPCCQCCVLLGHHSNARTSSPSFVGIRYNPAPLFPVRYARSHMCVYRRHQHRSAPQVDSSPYIDAAAQCRDQGDRVWCVQQLGRPWAESAFTHAVACRTVGLVEWMGTHGCRMPVRTGSVGQTRKSFGNGVDVCVQQAGEVSTLLHATGTCWSCHEVMAVVLYTNAQRTSRRRRIPYSHLRGLWQSVHAALTIPFLPPAPVRPTARRTSRP